MNDQVLHHAIQDITPVIVLVAMTIGAVSVLKSLIAAYRSRVIVRAQTELNNKVFEKFASADEFTAYLQSDAGKTFFNNLAQEQPAPLGKILGSIQKGAILTLFGLGFLAISGIFGTSDSQNIMLIVATVALTTGIGFLASSFISYRLAKSWGMISKPEAKPLPAPNTATP